MLVHFSINFVKSREVLLRTNINRLHFGTDRVRVLGNVSIFLYLLFHVIMFFGLSGLSYSGLVCADFCNRLFACDLGVL